jgi:hypothetical protein
MSKKDKLTDEKILENIEISKKESYNDTSEDIILDEKLEEKTKVKPVQIKSEKIEDVLKEEYEKQSISKKDLEDDLKFLKEKKIYNLSIWAELSEGEKDKDGYPRGLRKILDRISNSNLFILLFSIGSKEGNN